MLAWDDVDLSDGGKPHLPTTIPTTVDEALTNIAWQVLWFHPAGVAELVDARDLKSLGPQGLCGFDSRPPHHAFYHLRRFIIRQ
jgi:hypothetical protein